MEKALPESFKPYLWSVNFSTLDAHKDKIYVIHQVLSHGSLKDIFLLINIYSLTEVKKVFINSPSPLYTPRSLAFLVNFILKIPSKLAVTNYLKNVYGPATRSGKNQGLAKS